jgi:hypothetical protein
MAKVSELNDGNACVQPRIATVPRNPVISIERPTGILRTNRTKSAPRPRRPTAVSLIADSHGAALVEQHRTSRFTASTTASMTSTAA